MNILATTFSCTDEDGSSVSISRNEEKQIIIASGEQSVTLSGSDGIIEWLADAVTRMRYEKRREAWTPEQERETADRWLRNHGEGPAREGPKPVRAVEEVRGNIITMISTLQKTLGPQGPSLNQIAGYLNMPTRTVKEHIAVLEQEGRVHVFGGTKGIPQTFMVGRDSPIA